MWMHYLRFGCFVGFLFTAAGIIYAADPPVPRDLEVLEQKVLDRFLGTWRSTYKLPKAVFTPEEKTGVAHVTNTRVLGGHYIQMESEHADGTNTMVIFTYDIHRETYRSWWFSSTGQKSESTGTWDADSKTLSWTEVSTGDRKITTTATTRFVNDDTTETVVLATDGTGKIFFRLEEKSVRIDAALVRRGLHALKGSWRPVSIKKDGKLADLNEGKHDVILTCEESGVFSARDKKENEIAGVVKIDPTTKPKTIYARITWSRGPEKKLVLSGIYEIEGDTLRVCIAPPGSKWPTELSSKAGSGHYLLVGKRLKE